MTRFVANYGSTTEAINALADFVQEVMQKTRTAKTDGAATLTVGQLINGVLFASGSNGAYNLTLPSATLIVAALQNAQVGSAFEFELVNENDNTITIVAGSGNTLAGDTAVPTTYAQRYVGFVTNVSTPAVTVQAILTAQQLQDLTA